jgi:hypothetical protein
MVVDMVVRSPLKPAQMHSATRDPSLHPVSDMGDYLEADFELELGLQWSLTAGCNILTTSSGQPGRGNDDYLTQDSASSALEWQPTGRRAQGIVVPWTPETLSL